MFPTLSFTLKSTLARASALLVLTGASCLSAQITLNVGPGQTYTTIQSGINAANTGDTVLVAPGTYYENIDFLGKAITVTSSGGAATTTIDGGAKGPAVTFKTSETRSSVLSNFTIQHGGVFDYTLFVNGGIYLSNSAPSILNNTLTQNNCWTIYSVQSAPLIQGNEISATQDPHGQCSFGGGAGIYLSGNLNGASSPSTATSPLIFGNTIENNVESGLEDAGGNGGAGIAVWGGAPFIENNIIRNNSSPGGSGGAINFQFGEGATVLQNLIYNNQAGCGGGAIAFQGNPEAATGLSFVFANNTIVNNTGQANAGYSECIAISQIYPAPDSYGIVNPTGIFVNNVLSGSTTDPAVNCDWFGPVTEASQSIFDHNILYNAGGPFFGSYCVDVSSKYGNLSVDPQFVDLAHNDFHLKSTSPAIDAGNTSVLQSVTQLTGSAISQDYDGNVRVQDATHKGYPVLDIGAYEYTGTVDATPTTVVLTSNAYYGNAGSSYVLTATFASSLGTPTGAASFFLDNRQIGQSTLTSGVATLSNFLMTPGVHALYATYPGQGSFTPATSVIIIVDVSLYTTSLSLTSSANPSITGQPVTFTINAAAADNTIPTPVTLTDATTHTLLATLTPNASGVATYTTSALSLGTHTLLAAYAGTSSYNPSSSGLSQDVIADPANDTITTLTCNPTTLSVNMTSLFTATVSSASGTPAGSVIFTDNGIALSQPTLVNGVASYTLTSRQSGTRTIIATYVPTGSLTASSASCVLTVSGVTSSTTLSVSPLATSQGSPVTLTAYVSADIAGRGSPAGTVTFYNGSTVIAADVHLAQGIATFTTTFLPPGIDYLTCTYSGTATFAPSTCNTVAVTITQGSPAISLTSSANPAPSLTPITFTAQVAPGSSGTIVFNVNGQNITTTPNAAGIATTTTSALTPGSYLITATYFATPNALAAQASLNQVVTVPVAAPDFSLTGTDTTVAINHTVTGRILLASLGTFSGSVALTCTPPYPPGYTCKLQASTVSLPLGFNTYDEYTLSPTYSTSNQPIAHSTRLALAALFPLSFFGLMGLARKRRTAIRSLLCLVVLTTLASMTTACGPDHFIPLTLGTYPLTFTGVGTSQNNPTPITHTLTINVTIAR